jgi:hypothetical protein
MSSITSKIGIILLSLMASTFTFAEDKAAEEWLFVHTTEEAQVTNNTTIVMPVTRDIFALTDRHYRKHAYMTGEQFASLWANSFKTDPPNAVLTWVDGEDVKEAELVITGASIDGTSITYTTNSHRNTVGTIKSVSLFVDGVVSWALLPRKPFIPSRINMNCGLGATGQTDPPWITSWNRGQRREAMPQTSRQIRP